MENFIFCAVRPMKYEIITTGVYADYRAPWLFAWSKKVPKIVTAIRHWVFSFNKRFYKQKEGVLYWIRNKKYHFKY